MPPYSIFHCEFFFPSQHLTLLLYPKGHSHPRAWFPLPIVSPKEWGSLPLPTHPNVHQVLGTTTSIQLLKWKPIAPGWGCEWSCWYKIVVSIVASVLTSARQKSQGVGLKKERDGFPKMMQGSGLAHIMRTARNYCVSNSCSNYITSLLFLLISPHAICPPNKWERDSTNNTESICYGRGSIHFMMG